MNHIASILFSLCLLQSSFAQLSEEQESKVDSLKLVINNAKHDTIIINAWVAWDNIIYSSDPELDLVLNHKIDSLANINLNQNPNDEEKEKFLKSRAFSLNNSGIIYHDHGNYAKAIDCYTKSLKIREGLGYKSGISGSLNNIGNIYHDQGDYTRALDHYKQSLKIEEEIGDKEGIATALHNIGQVYHDQRNYAQAVDYYKHSLKLEEEIGNREGIAYTLQNIGNIYHGQENYAKALEYYIKCLQIREEIGDKNGIGSSYYTIGLNYVAQGNFTKALEFSNLALGVSVKLEDAIITKGASETLWIIHKSLGNYKESLKMYELYNATRDSINSEENQKAVIRQEYQYQYEKQAAADSIKTAEADKVKDALLLAEKAENKQHELEAEQQEEQKMYLFGGLALALLFGGFVFNRFRITSKQKSIIEEQKIKVDEAFDELEEKNNEILDSINYAKRIQSAILPPSKLVKEYLNQSFILYKPKDIVAGDFYWVEPHEDGVLFASADCTGHGVPGAMVSVVCNNGLNRSVREYGLTDPGQILDKTREIVISEFEKSEEEVKDGMDIALCLLQGTALKYAGAHNPLWIIRKDAKEVEEIKANKQPIGKYDAPEPYTTHTIELKEGDSFYIFSDGYADQFGGDRGKKYKTANFKRLLLSIQNENIEKQKQLIDESFEAWKGELEQLDDVCVIGVQV